jgi:hypothetical protein
MSRILGKLLTPRPCPVVKRSATTYLVSQGWEFKGGEFPHWEGHYKTPKAEFRGWIDQVARPRYCIFKPPEALKRAYASNIIDQHREGWHTVHFCTQPKDLDSGVLEIERLLKQALREEGDATA